MAYRVIVLVTETTLDTARVEGLEQSRGPLPHTPKLPIADMPQLGNSFVLPRKGPVGIPHLYRQMLC